MKNFVSATLLLVLASAFSAAQATRGPGLFPPPLLKYLDLSKSQLAEIVQINASYLEAREQLVARLPAASSANQSGTQASEPPSVPLTTGHQPSSSPEQQLADLRRRAHEKIASILNDDQKRKLQTLEDAIRLESLARMAQCQNVLLNPADSCQPSVPAEQQRIQPGTQPMPPKQ